MAKKNTSGKKNAARKAPTVDDLRDPLLAAVGVLDLALAQLDEIVDAMRGARRSR